MKAQIELDHKFLLDYIKQNNISLDVIINSEVIKQSVDQAVSKMYERYTKPMVQNRVKESLENQVDKELTILINNKLKEITKEYLDSKQVAITNKIDEYAKVIESKIDKYWQESFLKNIDLYISNEVERRVQQTITSIQEREAIFK